MSFIDSDMFLPSWTWAVVFLCVVTGNIDPFFSEVEKNLYESHC